MSNSILGWHWLTADRRLQFGSREVVEVGKTYTVDGPLVMCENGMHASCWVLDSLQYAPGPIVCRVRLTGEIQHGKDKSVARRRTPLWIGDATTVLHEFALVCAEDALGFQAALGHEPDSRSWMALDAKRRWLRGEITDQELADVRAAAWAAVGADWAGADWAALNAAGAAAWAAAWAATGAAAGAAARAAYAAATAARAIRATQNQILEQMIME